MKELTVLERIEQELGHPVDKAALEEKLRQLRHKIRHDKSLHVPKDCYKLFTMEALTSNKECENIYLSIYGKETL